MTDFTQLNFEKEPFFLKMQFREGAFFYVEFCEDVFFNVEFCDGGGGALNRPDFI